MITLKQIIRNINSLQNSIEKSEVELNQLKEQATATQKRFDAFKTKYDASIQELIKFLTND
jgi:predicted  nucleic acid-binding Zn-ribbon protein